METIKLKKGIKQVAKVNVFSIILLMGTFTECVAQKSFRPNGKKDIENNCGGFTSASLKNINIKDSVVIYGWVKTCIGNVDAPITVISIKNESQKVVKNFTTNIRGYYKAKIIAGTYSIYSANVSFGKIETGLLDYLPGDSVKVNLFLSKGEGLKD